MSDLQNILAKIPKDSAAYDYVDAVESVYKDYETVTNMAGLAYSVLESVHAITGAAGDVVQAAQQAADIGAEVGSAVADGVGAVLDIVPVIGAVVGAIVKIVANVVGANAASDARRDQLILSGQNAFIQNAKAIGIDTGDVYPADIFAQIYMNDPTWKQDGVCIVWHPQVVVPGVLTSRTPPPASSMMGAGRLAVCDNVLSSLPGPGQYPTGPNMGMPALGFALVRATEGWGLLGGQTELDILRTTYPFLSKEPNIGIPPERRVLYSKVRKAIQSQLGVHGSNEGQELWPIYVDMLRQDFAAGRLSVAWIAWLLLEPVAGTATVPISGGGIVYGSGHMSDPYFRGTAPLGMAPIAPEDFGKYGLASDWNSLAQCVQDLVTKWVNFTHPVTMPDARKFIDMVASTPGIGLDAEVLKKKLTKGTFDSTIAQVNKSLDAVVAAATKRVLGGGLKPLFLRALVAPGLSELCKAPFGRELVRGLQRYTPAVRASVLLGAYHRFLSRPKPPPLAGKITSLFASPKKG